MKINRTRIFKSKVDVTIPDGETDRVETFIGHFLALPSDELQQWPGHTLEDQDTNLRRVFVGWEGLVDDGEGETAQPYLFTPENRDDMIRDLFIRRALLRTYAVALSGAKRGN